MTWSRITTRRPTRSTWTIHSRRPLITTSKEVNLINQRQTFASQIPQMTYNFRKSTKNKLFKRQTLSRYRMRSRPVSLSSRRRARPWQLIIYFHRLSRVQHQMTSTQWHLVIQKWTTVHMMNWLGDNCALTLGNILSQSLSARRGSLPSKPKRKVDSSTFRSIECSPRRTKVWRG